MTTNADIARTFRDTFNGQGNFMTPHLIRYGRKRNLIYELSKGSGLVPGTIIYGVTVLTKAGERTRLSEGGFESLEDAEAYIKTLGDKQ